MPHVRRDEIDVAVPIEVAARQSDAQLHVSGKRAGPVGDAHEVSVAIARQQQIGFGVAVPELATAGPLQDGSAHDPSVDHRQVQVAIIVKIEECTAHTGMWEQGDRKPGVRRCLSEQPFSPA